MFNYELNAVFNFYGTLVIITATLNARQNNEFCMNSDLVCALIDSEGDTRGKAIWEKGQLISLDVNLIK